MAAAVLARDSFRTSTRRALAGPLGFTLATFAASRLFFFVAGYLAAKHLRWAHPAGYIFEPVGRLSYWAHWDGEWYVALARHGYERVLPEFSPVYFPLFPLTVRALNGVLGGPAVAGVVVSTVATAFALYFLYRIAESRWGTRTARASTLAFAFFPTSFFMNAVFTEGLFLALTTGSVWALLVRRQPLLGGVLGGLATATRQVGIFLVVPFAYELWRERDFSIRRLAALALVPSGLVAYMAYLWAEFGDPLKFEHAEKSGWGRRPTSPITTVHRLWHESGPGFHYLAHPWTVFRTDSPAPGFLISNSLNVILVVVLLALLVGAFALTRVDLALYAVATSFASVIYQSPSQPPLFGHSRYMLGAFPIFIVLGRVLERTRAGLAVWLAVSATLGGFLTALFTTWRWVA